MTSIKPYIISHLNLSCGNPITRSAVIDLMDHAMSACPEDEANEVDEIEIVK